MVSYHEPRKTIGIYFHREIGLPFIPGLTQRNQRALECQYSGLLFNDKPLPYLASDTRRQFIKSNETSE